MNIHCPPPLNLQVFEPTLFGDDRGFFLETWNQARYAEAGLSASFVQDNISRSSHKVLRGLHFQNPTPQGKLVSVLEGEVFDVAVDIRVGSPTFAKWFGIILDGSSKRQLYVPENFAHGFVVLSEYATFLYKCTSAYESAHENSLIWNDPMLNIEWPVDEPILSNKDSQGKSLQQLKDEGRLPRFEGKCTPYSEGSCTAVDSVTI
jgi:dTDP-4-dehydrorhamnose 3,5-epimerase